MDWLREGIGVRFGILEIVLLAVLALLLYGGIKLSGADKVYAAHFLALREGLKGRGARKQKKEGLSVGTSRDI